MIPNLTEIKAAINNANKLLIIQADNPDGDSLGSSLALEQILGDLGKEVFMYCGVDIPTYLKYLNGWDRVSADIPHDFDVSIIVDTSANSLLEKLNSSEQKMWVAAKPVIVLDHHSGVECDIPYASIVTNAPEFVSTGELIFELAKNYSWKLNTEASELLMQSILSDTLGLTVDGPTSDTYRRIAELIDNGANRPKLEESRREFSKMHPKVYAYKAKLIERTEFYFEGELAVCTIPEDEIFEISPLYNPGALIVAEMSMVEGVKISIALKRYKNKITAAIRCGQQTPIANKLAKIFGGGGHAYAAGFKIEDDSINFAELKATILSESHKLLK